MTEERLTASQRRTLCELQRWTQRHGMPPTVGELARQLKVRPSAVHRDLAELIEQGFVRKHHGKARGLEVLRTLQARVLSVVAVPIVGSIPAGEPIETDACEDGEVTVDAGLVGEHRCFALRVSGESMRDADIRDGDTIIVRQQPLASDGDIIVASVDGQLTVKRLHMRDGRIRLLPANDQFEPIEIEPDTELRVLGKVIATRRLVAGPRADVSL